MLNDLDQDSSGYIERWFYMRVGLTVYGLASAAAGIMDLVWSDFDQAHQPIQAFGDHIPGREISTKFVIALQIGIKDQRQYREPFV
jgi:hypothetical protein